ncbi:hypothetical protein HGRIS_011619 [Hohenbuehelia grisea]|uniref:PIN domain-like protein n=1 Tax=Hohenbuehelia grisea TaxID=104357 RepID=A0ABR3JX07_9AGAR
MGVLGLTPFLLKQCPDVIKQLPNRLRALTGKKIVIDGTLITQRLHFAPVPHPYRHVLGWYRLVQELRDAGVDVICVFDGKERTQAKSGEAARRKEIQKQTASRGAIEKQRLTRLQLVSSLLHSSPQLTTAQRQRAATRLREAEIVPDTPALPSIQDNTQSREGCQMVETSSPDGALTLPSIQDDFQSQQVLETEATASHAGPASVSIQDESQTQVEVTISSDDATTLPSTPDDYAAQSTPKAEATASHDASSIQDDFATHPTSEVEATTAHDASTHDDFASHLTSEVTTPNDASTLSSMPDDPIIQQAAEITELDDTPTLPSIHADSQSQPTQAVETAAHEDATGEGLHTQPTQEVEMAASDDATGEYFQTSLLDIVEDPEDQDRVALEYSELTDEEIDMFVREDSSLGGYHFDEGQLPGELPLVETMRDIYSLPSSYPDTDSETISSETLSIQPVPDVVEVLASFYSDYRKSIPKVTAVRPEPFLTEESDDVSSKHQTQLTTEEGKFWDDLVDHFASTPSVASSPTDEPVDTPVPLSRLATLAEKSRLMSTSYERRLNLPTSETYADSREILAAMGIPCIETTGPYEAEALASSLVRNGYADFVASEDTDVLVYEAPLLRNLTNRAGPLTILSGADIRASLDLSRSSYVDFALLLGTDFSARIKNVGPARALRFIREYHTIEDIIAAEGARFPPRTEVSTYLEQIHAARQVFETLPPVPEGIEALQMKDVDDAEVRKLLAKFGLGRYLNVVSEDWDYHAPLAGNFFNDDPSAYAMR